MSPGEPIDGVLLVDKPGGWTSHDVVAKLRRISGERRIGHTGTLDPMATGLLVLCLGRATRLVEHMAVHDKCYRGEVVLGVATDTDDAEGEAVGGGPVPPLEAALLGQLTEEFSGRIWQRPPVYSAVQVGGRRAYAAARSGAPLELAPRAVVVHRLAIEVLGADRLGVRVECGAGTYIRSLARDIGARLGCGAHLAALRRTAVGGFDVAEALTVDEVAEVALANRLGDLVLQPDEGVPELDAAIVALEHAAALAHGVPVRTASGPLRGAETARLYGTDGSFIGIGTVGDGGEIRAQKVFRFEH